MNSHKPRAVAAMCPSFHHGDYLKPAGTLGSNPCPRADRAAATGSRSADAGRDLPGGHDRRGRRGDGARRAAGHLRAGARDRIPRSRQALVGDRLDRLAGLGPVVHRPASCRAAPVRRSWTARGIPPRPLPATCCSISGPSRMDVCFELASRILKSMAGAVTVVDEVHGFQFFDNRDLLGFVDGTENPDGAAGGPPPPLLATRIPISPAPAMCTCRSTCTTWRPGSRCRSPSRSA